MYKKHFTLAWPCNFSTSWFKRSFVIFRLSTIPLENTGVVERVGLDFFEYGDAGLEVIGSCGDDVTIGFKAC